MNPPSSSRPGPSSPQLRGCEGDGCASATDTWPLHHVYRRGVRSRLCSSCILLSHRSYYCCSCFFLIPCPALWSPDDEVAHLIAPTSPIATCDVCHEAIAHLSCLRGPANGGAAVFVCPACRAAQEGRPFTYAPPCSTPLDERGARVLVIGARLALLLLKRNAGVARAEAERLARNAVALRRRANQALDVTMEFDTEAPSWNVNIQPEPEPVAVAPPPPSENRRLELGEGSGTTSVADAPPPPPAVHHQLRRTTPLPPLSALNIGGRGSGVTQLAMAATEAARDSRPPRPPRRTLPLFGATEAATAAAAEASSSRPPTPPTLQLFPVNASSSRRRPKRRALQLFQDKIPDDEEM